MQIFYISLHQMSFFLLQKNIFNLVHFLLPTFVHHSETYSLSVAMQIAENTILLFLSKNYSKTSIFGFFKNFNALTVLTYIFR